MIDFGEDENIEEGLLPQGKLYSISPLFMYLPHAVRGRVEQLLKDITAHLNDGRRGERLRSGVHVTIVGAPNAGKSSLLNILCEPYFFVLCSPSLHYFSFKLPPPPFPSSSFRSASCSDSLTTCWHY